MADRFPEAELVLDDELMFDDAPRRSTFLRRTDDRAIEQIVREGEVLAGKYRVERIPGRSGLGVVVHVRHMELSQEVTLKFLVPDACAYPEFVQRFVREARSAVKIQGEHVARVTDVGRLDSGAPYMVREFLRGPDLAEVIKVRGRLPVAEAVDYLIQACEGVAEGHALGIVHRNIKPTSLVVTRRSDGTPLIKVFDFAAAESLHVDPFTERSVALVGTSAIMASLPYLAPEQIRDPHDVDVRADIYSLGAVLFELLSGTPVYSADSAPALLAMVAADAAVPVRQHVPDAPGELDLIVLRCLSKNRAIRYASVADLALALRPFATDDANNSIDRIVRLAKISNRPVDLSAPRHVSPVAALPDVAPPPASPFTPSPSAVPPPARGPHGTVMLHMTEPARPVTRVQQPSVLFHEPGNDDVTSIGAHVARPIAPVAPLLISPPPPVAPRYTPQPPPLRTSVPPPLRAASPPPPPVTTQPLPGPLPSTLPEARNPTSLPPPRTSIPGLTRSWAVEDIPATPLFTRNRLIGIGVVAACATLGGVLALRSSAPKAPVAAAALPARIQAPPPAPPPVVPPPEPVPEVASAAPVASQAPAPVAPLAVAAPAPAAPAPVVAAVAPAAPRVAAAPVARPLPAPRPAKPEAVAAQAPAAPEKLARARPGAGPDLFDDPR